MKRNAFLLASFVGLNSNLAPACAQGVAPKAPLKPATKAPSEKPKEKIALNLEAFKVPGSSPAGALTLSSERIAKSAVPMDLYFPLQAALVLYRMNVDPTDILKELVPFMIEKQAANGRFGRYELSPNATEWKRVKDTDADDVLSAFCMFAMITTAPKEGLVGDRKTCFDRAATWLAKLQNQETKLYRTFLADDAAQYTADNCEIYAAFVAISEEFKKRGILKEAQEFEEKASELKKAILTHLVNKDGSVKVAANRDDIKSFYPGDVASLFIDMFVIASPETAKKNWKAWNENHQTTWFEQGQTSFPWGIIALHAYNMGDKATAEKWFDEVATWRQGGRIQIGKHWHIAEEIFTQVLAKKLGFDLENLRPRNASRPPGNKGFILTAGI